MSEQTKAQRRKSSCPQSGRAEIKSRSFCLQSVCSFYPDACLEGQEKLWNTFQMSEFSKI